MIDHWNWTVCHCAGIQNHNSTSQVSCSKHDAEAKTWMEPVLAKLKVEHLSLSNVNNCHSKLQETMKKHRDFL